MDPTEEERRDAVGLVEAASEVTGAAAGAAVGLLVGGPPGAVGGAVAGSLVKLGADFFHRRLSPRQATRTGTALEAAATRTWFRLMDGDQIREDGFFTEDMPGSSPSAEVGEAVLLAVRDESELRKVPYMGYLLANIGFESAVDPRTAHDLIEEAEALSYTQLALLSAIDRMDTFPLPTGDVAGVVGTLEAVTVRSQFDDLGYARRELIGVGRPERGLPTNIDVPSDQRFRNRGRVLVSLMELNRVPDEDVEAAVHLLWKSFGRNPP